MINRGRRILAGLLAGLLVSGCMSRMAAEDTGQAEALMRQFLVDMLEGDTKGMVAASSAPFWMDEWIIDADALSEEMPDDPPEDQMQLAEVRVRVYPLGDLAVLRPLIWRELQKADPDWLKDLSVVAVALRIKGHDKTEAGLALLRRVNGEWRLAGLIEE